jgi:hypothetical protein
MKTILVALLLTIPVASYAASPEQTYLAARDAAIRKIEQSSKRKDSEDAQMKLHDAALAGLEKQIRPVVGPSEIKGFPSDGKINLSALSKGDMGYGTLDGLVYRSADERSSVTVTTEALLKVWLKAHRNWWRGLENAPEDVAKALRSNAFYTQSLDSDAAFSQFAELPILKPANGLAVALLGYRAQDIGPSPANLIIVAAVRGGRVFLVSAAATATVEDMPACQPIWDDSVRKAAELFKKWEEGGRKNAAQFDQTRIENEADAAYRKCFGERVKADPRFKTLTEQAQALLDALPAK